MHALRVYWQFQEWANLSHLDPSQHGWKKVNNEYYPIGALNDIAPEGLFNFISCKWEKGCRGKCSCIMNGSVCQLVLTVNESYVKMFRVLLFWRIWKKILITRGELLNPLYISTDDYTSNSFSMSV